MGARNARRTMYDLHVTSAAHVFLVVRFCEGMSLLCLPVRESSLTSIAHVMVVRSLSEQLLVAVSSFELVRQRLSGLAFLCCWDHYLCMFARKMKNVSSA